MILFLVYLAAFSLPSALMFFGAQSFSIGTLVFLFPLVVLSRPKIHKPILYGILVILVYSIISMLISENFERISSSTLYGFALLYISLAIPTLLRLVSKIRAKYFQNVFRCVFWILSISAILCFEVGVGQSILNRPMFPYIEPSHYFISISYLLLIMAVIGGKYFWVSILFIFSLAIYVESLVGLVALAYVLIISNFLNAKNGAKRKYSYYILIFLTLAMLVSVFTIMDISYYNDRITLDSSSNNLTVLSFLQGYESIWEHVIHFKLLGTGIGTFDLRLQNLESTFSIYDLAGVYLNEFDGGFIFSRLVGELGILAFFLLVGYFRIFYTGWVLFRSSRLVIGEKIIICPIFVFPIELFLRSPGLLTPSLWFVLASVTLLLKKRQN